MALYDTQKNLIAGSRKTNIYRCNSFAEYEALPAAEKAKYDYVATPDGAIGDIKMKMAVVPCNEYSNNMNLTPYANAVLDSGYEFLCYTHVSSSGWIFPVELGVLYLASPGNITGAPFVKTPSQIPDSSSNYITFSFLEVKRI